jgi:methionyl-tRNA formyltransferase
MIKILFVGTAEFAVESLKYLANHSDIKLVGLITQPDKPAGRKRELTPSPVKSTWLELSISQTAPIFQPEKLRTEAEQILNQTTPDLVIVAAYGQMIPDLMLHAPKYGVWNLHGSLLPQLRGAVPVQRAILDGLETTGVTLQQMVKQLDAGDILLQKSLKIAPKDTTESLMTSLSLLSVSILKEGLEGSKQGSLIPTPQQESQATFCYEADIEKTQAQITWDTDVNKAERMVRAFSPWPVAWIELNTGKHSGRRLKIFKSSLATDLQSTGEFGLFSKDNRLYLSLKEGVLELEELQLEGSTRKTGREYLYLAEK